MPKEPAAYRDNLEDILTFTEGRRLVTQKEVAKYLGRDVKTVRRIYGVDKHGISAPTLARMLSAGW